MALLSTYPRISDPFRQGTHIGLNFAYGVGIVRNDNVVTEVNAGTVALTDNATNYIELILDGTIVKNTTGFTAGRIPLYKAITLSSAIASIEDNRSFISAGGGSGGGATVTDYTVTITTTWVGSSAPYSQAITVAGILATDTPFVDIVPSGIYATDVQMETDWSNIYRIVSSADTITFYSHAVTVASIPVQIKVVR